MAEALEASFSLEELEISQIEECASVPNFDNLTTCSCKGYCLRERGRNFCPCKSLNQFCSNVCHDGNSELCLNNRRIQEIDSEDTTDYESEGEFAAIESRIETEHEGGEHAYEHAGGQETGHGRGRGNIGQGRGHGRGEGRGRWKWRRQPDAFADIVNGEIVAEDGQLLHDVGQRQSDQSPPNEPPHDRDNTPEWCKCGHCVTMPTQEEN